MNRPTFSSAFKEIVLTGIAAMIIFSVAASQSAKADTIVKSISFEQAITIVTQAESDYIASKNSFTEIEHKYNLQKTSLSKLFIAQVTLNEAEKRVQLARTQLLISLSKIEDSGNTTLAFNRAL